MLRVALVRSAVGLLTLWAVSIVVFLGTAALPGDAARAALGREATPGAVAVLRAQFHLNRPLATRYWDWLTGFVQGDLGRALPSGERVTSLITGPVKNTAVLAAVTIAILIPLAVFLGIVSAVRRDRTFDHAIASTTLAMISLPEFVTGTLLAVLFAVWIPSLPAVSLVDPNRSLLSQRSILVLPVATLIVASVAQMIRLVRASMIDVLQSEYVETARLKFRMHSDPRSKSRPSPLHGSLAESLSQSPSSNTTASAWPSQAQSRTGTCPPCRRSQCSSRPCTSR
jgi:peptide/nickel transport system permease protein